MSEKHPSRSPLMKCLQWLAERLGCGERAECMDLHTVNLNHICVNDII